MARSMASLILSTVPQPGAGNYRGDQGERPEHPSAGREVQERQGDECSEAQDDQTDSDGQSTSREGSAAFTTRARSHSHWLGWGLIPEQPPHRNGGQHPDTRADRDAEPNALDQGPSQEQAPKHDTCSDLPAQ